jgi:hypothetical protein
MTDVDGAAARGTRPRLRPGVKRAIQIVVSVVLVGFIVWFVFGQFANLSDVTAVLRSLSAGEIAVLLLVATWNLLTYWGVVVVATPGMTVAQSAVLTQSTTAVSNAIPGGSAIAVGLTYAMMSSWGFSRSRTTLSVVVSGIWNNLIKLGMPILALALLAIQGEADAGRTVAALLGLVALVAAVACFALVLRSEAFAARVGIASGRLASKLLAVLKRPPVRGWDLAVVTWRSRVVGLVRHRWLALSVSAVASHVSLYAVLLVALRVAGVPSTDVGWAEVLAVFAFAPARDRHSIDARRGRRGRVGTDRRADPGRRRQCQRRGRRAAVPAADLRAADRHRCVHPCLLAEEHVVAGLGAGVERLSSDHHRIRSSAGSGFEPGS